MIVADINLIIYLLVKSPFTAQARRAFERDSDWVVPSMWRHEFINVMATSAREKKFSINDACEKILIADRLVTERKDPLADEEVIRLAVDHRIATYDCVYVLLGRRLGVRVVTQDRGMLSRFADTCVSITDFAAGS